MVRVTGCNRDRCTYTVRRIAAQEHRGTPSGGGWHINPPNLTALHSLPLFFRQPFGEQFGGALRPVEIFWVPLMPFHV